MSLRWYAINTKANKEKFVAELLRAKLFKVFYPTMKIQSHNSKVPKLRPYFPGYLFVQADLRKVGSNIFSWFPGVKNIVSFDRNPSVVPDDFIITLRDYLEKINNTKEPIRGPFEKGDQVYIVDGFFAGYEAIFDCYLDGKDRVRLLLSLMGNASPVKLETSLALISQRTNDFTT